MLKFISVVFLALTSAIAAFGQTLFSHNPNDLTIYKEARLCGIDFTTGIEMVIQQLGEPTRVKTDYVEVIKGKPQIPSGFVTYEWQNTSWRLRVVTLHPATGPVRITQVDIWGKKADAQIGFTGRGLRLGDSIADVHRIYGSENDIFPTEKHPDWNLYWIHLAQGLRFSPQDATLEIGFDAHDRVDHLGLRPPCCEY